jgi:hypothetical protein
MLNELLKHNALGNARELIFVLFQTRTPELEHRLEDVRRFCTSNVFSISHSFDGIVALLQFVSIIKVDKYNISIDQSVFDPRDFISQDNYFREPHFFSCLFSRLSESDYGKALFNEDNVKFSHETNQYYVKSHLINFGYFPIRNLLLKLAFLERDNIIPDHLIISAHFTEFFQEVVISRFAPDIQQRKMTLDQLRKALEQKGEIGKQGELFTLNYELDRLKGHPQFKEVKRISEEYVNAGYDIISFDNLDSFINDRFIEVKTYINDVAFYWSKHEVEIARDLTTKYWLYFVDLAKTDTEGYTPKMLQDPFRKIFENENWKKETENWKISLEL